MRTGNRFGKWDNGESSLPAEEGSAMRIEYLREFVKLASTLSYTETAKELHLTQPALSKHIGTMERSLGIQLFARSSSGVRLTQAGSEFYEDALRVVNEFDYAVERVQARKRKFSSVLRIGYLRDAAGVALPSLYAWFKENCPGMELRFLSVDYMHLAEDLRSRQAEAIITIDDDPRLHGECGTAPLYDDTFEVAVPAQHPLARRDSVRLEELEGERLLVPSHHVWPSLRTFIDERLSPKMLENSQRMSDVDTLFFRIGTGQGVAVVMSHNRHAHGEGVRFLRIDEPNVPTFPVSAMWLKASERYDGMMHASQLMQKACESVRAELAAKAHPLRSATA